MVVVPYYNKPTQEGLYRHFVEVASRVRVPVVVYNVPGRTVVDLAPETLARICEAAPNVVVVKEATGNVLRAQRLAQTLGDRIAVLCGDDALTLPMVACGARGVISVTSNVLPAEVSRATRLALDGRIDEARRAHLALLPVHEAMFIESSPAPVKARLRCAASTKDGGAVADLPALGSVARGHRRRARELRAGRTLMRLALVGASGRMGRAIVRLAHRRRHRDRVRRRRDRRGTRRRGSRGRGPDWHDASSTGSPQSSTRGPTSSSTSPRRP